MTRKYNLAEALDFTKDATLGMPVVTAIGNYELYVENFKSIVSYEGDMLKLLTRKGMLTVCGEALEILYYDDEEIAVRGCIKKIEF